MFVLRYIKIFTGHSTCQSLDHDSHDTKEANNTADCKINVDEQHKEEALGNQIAACRLIVFQEVTRANLAGVHEAEDDTNEQSDIHELTGDGSGATSDQANRLHINAVEDSHGKNDDSSVVADGKNDSETFSNINDTLSITGIHAWNGEIGLI